MAIPMRFYCHNDMAVWNKESDDQLKLLTQAVVWMAIVLVEIWHVQAQHFGFNWQHSWLLSELFFIGLVHHWLKSSLVRWNQT